VSGQASQMGGLVIRYKEGHHFRVWRYGYEWGWPGGGRIKFFPWTKQAKALKEYHGSEATITIEDSGGEK